MNFNGLSPYLTDFLRNCNTSVQDAEAFVLDKMREGKLQLVDLYDSTHIESAQVMLGFLKAVAAFGELKELDFSNTTFSVSAWEILIQNFPKGITALHFGKLTPVMMTSLSSIPPDCLNTVTALTLQGVGEKIEVGPLNQILQKTPLLTHFTLTEVSLRSEQLKEFSSVLKLPLSSLNLSHNLLGVEGLTIILHHLKSLTHLNLEENRITSLPTGFLLTVFDSALLVVKLSYNRLPDKELEDVTKIDRLNQNKSLQVQFFPQNVSPSPDYLTLLVRLDILNVKTYLPEKIDLRHNQIPAEHLLAFLKRVFQAHTRPFLFEESSLLLPQTVAYTVQQTEQITKELTNYCIPIKHFIDSDDEEIVIVDPSAILSKPLKNRFRVHETMDGQLVWMILAGLFQITRKGVIEALFPYFQSEMAKWNKITAEPAAHLEEIFPCISEAFQTEIWVYHQDWTGGPPSITYAFEAKEREKEPLYFYKDGEGTYYSLDLK
jgi:hypothetical protein